MNAEIIMIIIMATTTIVKVHTNEFYITIGI
jgi:hypothetical protein